MSRERSNGQEIWRAVSDWRERHSPDGPLVLGLLTNPQFAAELRDVIAPSVPTYGDTSVQLNAVEIRDVAKALFTEMATRQGRDANHDSAPGFIELGRCAIARPLRKSHMRWLLTCIQATVSRSLWLTCDLEYYWGSEKYYIERGESEQLAEAIANTARQCLPSTDALVATLSPSHPRTLQQAIWRWAVVYAQNADYQLSHFERWQSQAEFYQPVLDRWRWVFPLLREALKRGNIAVLAQVMMLATRFKEDFVDDPTDGRLIRRAEVLFLEPLIDALAIDRTALFTAMAGFDITRYEREAGPLPKDITGPALEDVAAAARSNL